MELKNKGANRFISIVLSVAMVFCGLTLSTSNVSADETSGDYEYTANGDEVTITAYTGTDKNVVIPSTIAEKPVTSIKYGAFASKSLENVTIPEGVKKIGSSAFQNNNLTSIIIPSSVTTIGLGAFVNNDLTSVTIPEGVTTIENFVFQNNNLASVIIPSSVTTIGSYAFSYQYNSEIVPTPVLESVVILSKTTSIGDKAFDGVPTAFRIYGYTDSTVKTYAESNHYNFVALNELTVETIADQGWTGSKIEPEVVVKDKDNANKTLTKDVDYTVTYKNNINAGTATATITGIGDYEYATATKDFTIIKYTFTEGTNQTITTGDNKDLTFKVDGPLELLDKVYINDKELDAANYTTLSGSTIITLKKEYISTLIAGTYTLKATYTNGVSASTDFIIKAKETPTTPTNPGASTDPTDLADTTKSPKTGDTSDMGMWIVLLVLAAVTTTVAYRKRTDR